MRRKGLGSRKVVQSERAAQRHAALPGNLLHATLATFARTTFGHARPEQLMLSVPVETYEGTYASQENGVYIN
jgi:hypothetical protein